MGHSFPNLEEDKNNPPPKSPAIANEKHPEPSVGGEYEIKYVKTKRKPKNPPLTELLTGEPEFASLINF